MELKIPEIEEIRQQLHQVLAYIQQKEAQKAGDEWMNVEEVARFLKTTPGVIYQRKDIPYFEKIGKKYFLKSQISDWIKSGGNVRVKTKELDIQRSRKAS